MLPNSNLFSGHYQAITATDLLAHILLYKKAGTTLCARSFRTRKTYTQESKMKKSINIAILTLSDSRTLQQDSSGQTLQDLASKEGHIVVERLIIPDDIYRMRLEVSRWIVDPGVEVVITTGGTGLTGRDNSPQALAPLFDRTLDGFSVLFHQVSYQSVRTSTIASRAIAGVANGTFIFCLPGSPGACKDAWQHILSDQLDCNHRPCNLVELMPRLMES